MPNINAAVVKASTTMPLVSRADCIHQAPGLNKKRLMGLRGESAEGKSSWRREGGKS